MPHTSTKALGCGLPTDHRAVWNASFDIGLTLSPIILGSCVPDNRLSFLQKLSNGMLACLGRIMRLEIDIKIVLIYPEFDPLNPLSCEPY